MVSHSYFLERNLLLDQCSLVCLAVDERCDMELDETDPTIWLKLEDAIDEYIEKNRQSFEHVCERLLLPFQHEENLRAQLPKRNSSNEGIADDLLCCCYL